MSGRREAAEAVGAAVLALTLWALYLYPLFFSACLPTKWPTNPCQGFHPWKLTELGLFLSAAVLVIGRHQLAFRASPFRQLLIVAAGIVFAVTLDPIARRAPVHHGVSAIYVESWFSSALPVLLLVPYVRRQLVGLVLLGLAACILVPQVLGTFA